MVLRESFGGRQEKEATMGERQIAGQAKVWERYRETERRDLEIRRVPDCKGHAVSSGILHADDRDV